MSFYSVGRAAKHQFHGIHRFFSGVCLTQFSEVTNFGFVYITNQGHRFSEHLHCLPRLLQGIYYVCWFGELQNSVCSSIALCKGTLPGLVIKLNRLLGCNVLKDLEPLVRGVLIVMGPLTRSLNGRATKSAFFLLIIN